MLYPKTLQFPTCVVVRNPPEPGSDLERNFVIFESGHKTWTDKMQSYVDAGTLSK